ARAEDARALAVMIAGALAEMGVSRVAIVESGGGWRQFEARRTDLPGVIAEALQRGEVEVLALDRPLRMVVRADGMDWETGDEWAHGILRRVST
ncbi:MAG: hypothetical protein VYC34_09010, partial [Planctomycetota bacterium]|nr:hypothetical protein [Planctomycetota bacterium]